MKQYILLLCVMLAFFSCQRNAVTSIVLSEQEKVLEVGETLQLHAAVDATKDAGEFARVWASEDANVATVTQDGLITALVPGETLVTLTVGGKKAECRIGVKYFMQAQRQYMREPYSTGKSDLYTLCLATKSVDMNDLSGSGEYLSIELFVRPNVQDSLPTGIYNMVDNFTPPAAGTEYDTEYEKFVPYTLSPGFLMGTEHWGTWHRNLTTGQSRSLQAGTVEVRRSADGDAYIIRYDLSDGHGWSFTGVYEGKIE